jgi:hypothetical protein
MLVFGLNRRSLGEQKRRESQKCGYTTIGPHAAGVYTPRISEVERRKSFNRRGRGGRPEVAKKTASVKQFAEKSLGAS